MLPKMEKAFEDLVAIISTKYQLKENARTRGPKLFKTGHLKDGIDQLIPDKQLSKIACQLEKIYGYIQNMETLLKNHSVYVEYKNSGTEYESGYFKKHQALVGKIIGKGKIDIEYESINKTMGE